MKDEFVRNPTTGQIMRRNPSLNKRTDLEPCRAPWDTGDTPARATEQDEHLLPEDEGAALILEWFGREVKDVSAADLRAFAEERGIKITGRPKKIEMVTMINSGLTKKEM
jgi:hypothetical protein